MDLTIRQLLFDAEQRGDVEALKKAYQLIKAASEGQCPLDRSESFSLELAILCAEQALQMKLPDITESCVNLYFKGMPPSSQFRGRAYLCQAQLYRPESMEKLDEFEKSVTQFLKAVRFGSEDPRYYFLVYNASVLYWRMARAFLKPGHRQYLIPSLALIVNVLQQINEEDKDWQAELMIELLECYLEADNMEAAAKFCTSAAPFIKTNAPHRYQRIFSIMVQHNLMDEEIMKEEIKGSISLSILFNINTLKSEVNKKLPLQEANIYLKEAYDLLQQYEDQESVQDEKILLLLELARFSLSLKCLEISSDCIKDLKAMKHTDPGRMIEVECLEYELEILKIDSKVKAYTRGAVETQLTVIKRLNLALLRASRLKNPNVIQVVCATQWNLCLPLLQHNLRGHLLKPLIQVAEILEKIDSLMTMMRCQVHIEISHIEEDEDRLEVAMEHLQKAMHLDYLGEYEEHLKMAYNRLHLRAMLYQVPKRMEDKAIMAIEQAKKAKPKDSVRKKRALLVNVGLALAPDAFQIVLDGENEAKVSAGKSRRPISFLCAKARHHTSSIDKADGHLKRLKQDNREERIYIWADLAKVARKQGVWDVCRTACRFCLLYDVMAKKMSRVRKGPGRRKKVGTEVVLDVLSSSEMMPSSHIVAVDIQRTFAEVGFINAEAIIHFLQSEGIELNDRPIPPETSVQHHTGNIAVPPEEDAEWLTYSSWIENLSQYAMRNWLRSAEIGQEINEAWLVHNTVVYVLNHNHHLIAAGRQRELVDLLQALLNIMRITGHNGDTITLVLLCNALARGLILPWIPSHTSDRGRRFLKSTQTHVAPLEWNAMSEVKVATEVCDFGLTLTNGNLPEEIVPIVIRQQLIATWVKAKQLTQQQIGHKLGTDEESLNENEVRMTKVLVALEMYSCNGLGLMDFNLPTLAQVLKMASECIWTDPLMEIQSLVRLAHFAYMLRDHEIVMTLSKIVQTKGEKFFENQQEVKCSDQNDNLFRAELLSALLCTQGKSIMENLAGRKQLRQQAAKAFLGSIRYAGLAGNHTLVMQSARHYWNTCFPFFSSSFCRKKLKQSIQLILKTICKTENKEKCKERTLILHQWPSMDLQYSGNTDGHFQAEKASSNQEELLQESSEAAPKVTWETLTSVRQLETLAYAHTLMALVAGPGSSQFEENCLMAYRYIMRIWEVSLQTVGNILLTFQESPEEPSVQSQSLKKEKEKGKEEEKKEKGKEDKKEKGKEDKKEKGKEEKKEKGKEKGKEGKKEKGKDKDKDKQKEKKPSKELLRIQLIMANKPMEALPASVEEWAFYHCHKEVIALFIQDASDSTINSNTILKPNFSLYYLDQLVKALNSLYLIHLTLPILQFAVVISDLIIESKTVSDLYHLRLALACSELRLSEAAAYHEEIVGGVYINELEQASCRNEVRSRKEKRSEFLKEVANDENRPMKPSMPVPIVLEAKEKVLEINEQTGKGLQGISFPYLWMYKAEVLLEMDYYQPAWLLLAEAQVAFRELSDACAEARSLYLLSELAKKELKYEQAKKMIEKAQVLGGGEEFWYYSTVALIETLLAQERGRESLIPNIIQKTIDVFLSLIQERPNRKSILKFLATSLEARSAEIQLKIVLDSTGDDPLDFSYLLEAINYRLVKIEKNFLDGGYKDRCVDLILQSAKIKRLFAKYEKDEKAKVFYYLEAYNLTQKAIMYLEEIFDNVLSLLPLNETQNISTPLMRKLASVKLELADVSVEIIQYNQEKALQEEMKKGTWEKILADYLLNTSDFTKLEWDWFNLKRTVAHRTLAHLESMQHLCFGCKILQAKFFYFTGKTLHLLALQNDPVHLAHYWDENFLFDAKMTPMTSLETDKEETEAELTSKPNFVGISQNEDQIEKARELKKGFLLAQKFRSQASEVLLQCLQVCLNNNLISIAANASREMVESIGVMDQPSTCQFLALYQSCSASLAMRKLLRSVTTNTSSSQLAALLQLHQKLQQRGKTGTTLFENVEQKLWQISKAWQNLCITEQHFNILNDLPPSYQLIILQHSADRSTLYGMVYEKPKFGPGPKGKIIQISGQCKVFRVHKNPTTISQLLSSLSDFKEELVRSSPDEMLLEARVTTEEEKLIQKFNSISKSLEDYLKPVYTAIHHWDIRHQSEGVKKVKEKEQKSPSVIQDPQVPPAEFAEYLILIVDRLLLELPLEVVTAFENGTIGSVSRELSLQMLANRLHREEPEVSKREGRGSRDAKQKSKKFGKKASRLMPANCMPVESNNFKYVVDPFEEAKANTEAITPIFKAREILDKYRDSFTARWSGFLGSKNFPSQTDWEQCLNNCSGFFFYGMENLLSHVLIDSLITMNLKECQMIILLNLTHTVYSTRRRAKFDEIQRPSQLLLHKPVDTAILLSLIGVPCVMSNQWPTDLYCNANRAEVLCEDLLKIGKPSGKAIYHLLKSGLTEAIRKGDSPRTSGEKVLDQNASVPVHKVISMPPWANFNFVLFGLPNLFIV
ncbi:cilia- and flagella-associated protein 46 isoform X4 [Notamacropus eugenii]|uniref:cilia- and flagella-associated protein 46 isoform X4 n=1 Tax=Notamacropus eugenii TaxID=9315 RepID=UPI003B67603E